MALDILALAKQLAAVASTVAPAIGGPITGALQIGEKVVDLIDDVTSKVPETRGDAELAAARKVLADKVRSHAESTASRLEGQS